MTLPDMTGAPVQLQVVTCMLAARTVPSDVVTVQVATSCSYMAQMHMYRPSKAKFIAYMCWLAGRRSC